MNVQRHSVAGFNDPKSRCNILSAQLGHYRPVYELNVNIAEAKVARGLWLVVGADQKLVEVTGTTGLQGCKLILEPGEQSDIKAFPYSLDGGEHGGYMAVMFGVFRAEVGSDGFVEGEDYTPGAGLKVTVDGTLTPVTDPADIVTAYSEGINDQNMLVFTTHGAK